MFGDTLLESSSTARKRKRWPMAMAFTVQIILAAVLVLVPLLTTGVISVSARMPSFTPVKPVMLERVQPIASSNPHPSGLAAAPSRPMIVMANHNPNAIFVRSQAQFTDDIREVTPPGPIVGSNNPVPTGLLSTGRSGTNVKPGLKRVNVSVLSEAQLVNRVEPVYPRIATLAGIQGQVKLHAIIARDGSIQSLSATSGHPMLVQAALEAVRQWRYRPYILNGEAVEVETLITVNFNRNNH